MTTEKLSLETEQLDSRVTELLSHVKYFTSLETGLRPHFIVDVKTVSQLWDCNEDDLSLAIIGNVRRHSYTGKRDAVLSRAKQLTGGSVRIDVRFPSPRVYRELNFVALRTFCNMLKLQTLRQRERNVKN